MNSLQRANADYLRRQLLDRIPEGCTRRYQTPPADLSLRNCWTFGASHMAYEWSPQLDPRWSPEQVAAYVDGCCGVPLDPSFTHTHA